MADLAVWEGRLKRERQARKQAESIAEEKTRELFQTNHALQEFNEALEDRVRERTAELTAARDEALALARARSAAEEALRHAQARLNHLLRSSPAVIFSFKATDNFERTFISENIRHLVGYAPTEYLEGRHFW